MMLPEKRKNLIIAIVSIIVIAIVVIMIALLSKYIKDLNRENTPQDDNYTNIYDYIGITKDEDGIYKIYGINQNAETYLNLKTFYDIKDVLSINNRVVLYSDATNEIRYDKEKDEFYFYELDSYYAKAEKVNLTSDYVVMKKDSTLHYWEYGSEKKKNIDKVDDFLAINNKIYYLKNSEINVYDIKKNTTKLISVFDNYEEVNLLYVNNSYLYYMRSNMLYACNVNNLDCKNLDYILFLAPSKDGVITYSENTLKNYNIIKKKNVNEYELNGKLNKMIYLNNNLYYLSFEKNYVIIDMETENIWKNLENDYLYLVKVKNA